jgi:hypothetical protein
MVSLELRSIGAGVLARTYRRDDCTRFLDECIAKKVAEIDELGGVDPFTIAVLGAEITRLRTIRGLIDGTIPFVGTEDGTDDNAGTALGTLLGATRAAP